MFRNRLVVFAIVVASLGANAASVSTDVVLDWNVIALKTTAAAPFNPPLETRNLAIVHAAMFDAVNSIVGDSPGYVVRLRAGAHASAQAAAVAAARVTLVTLYPEQQSMLDAAYAAFSIAFPKVQPGIAVCVSAKLSLGES